MELGSFGDRPTERGCSEVLRPVATACLVDSLSEWLVIASK